EPTRVADGAVRLQGDGGQPRRGRVPPRGRREACRARAPGGAAAEAGEREGRGAALRALPRRRPRPRPGDAVDGRGDDERVGPSDGVCEGGAGRPLPMGGAVFLSVRDADKASAVPVAAALAGLGFQLWATDGTARTLRGAGLDVQAVRRVHERGGQPSVVDLIRRGRCNLVVNTPDNGPEPRQDGYLIREAALVARIPCITTIAAATAAVHAIANARAETALSLQERID